MKRQLQLGLGRLRCSLQPRRLFRSEILIAQSQRAWNDLCRYSLRRAPQGFSFEDMFRVRWDARTKGRSSRTEWRMLQRLSSNADAMRFRLATRSVLALLAKRRS